MIRLMRNLRYTPRLRPVISHRTCLRVENFGSRFILANVLLLAIRSFLVENGIKSTRMDVRALGNKIEGSPGDRVDLVLIER